MAIGHNQVTVTTEPTLLHVADQDGANLWLKPEAAMYIGNGDVSTSNGYLLKQNISFSVFVGPGEQLYGVKAEGTTTVYVLMTLNN